MEYLVFFYISVQVIHLEIILFLSFQCGRLLLLVIHCLIALARTPKTILYTSGKRRNLSCSWSSKTIFQYFTIKYDIIADFSYIPFIMSRMFFLLSVLCWVFFFLSAKLVLNLTICFYCIIWDDFFLHSFNVVYYFDYWIYF